MDHRKQSSSFRFLALSIPQLDELRTLCGHVVSRPARGKEGRVTGVFPLAAGADLSWVKRFVEKHQLGPSDYGLFISLSTSSDSEIVRVPDFATELFRDVGGVIDFSFTVLSAE